MSSTVADEAFCGSVATTMTGPGGLRQTVSPPNPVINVTDAHGRVMPVLVVTGGDEDDTAMADDSNGVDESPPNTVPLPPSVSGNTASAIVFTPGYFTTPTTGCN